MKLYFSPRSPFVRKVMVAVHELGLAGQVEPVPANVRMEEPNTTVLAQNPLGKIPTLVLDDGTTMFDSFVIVDYLDRLSGCRLIPAGGTSRDWVLKHHALANGLLDVLVLWRNERDKPEAQQSQGWIGNFHEKTQRTLDAFDMLVPALESQPFGLAQITIGVALCYLDFRFDALGWRNGRPALTRWHQAIAARPSFQATEARV